MSSRLQDLIRQASMRLGSSPAQPKVATEPSTGMVASLMLEAIGDNYRDLMRHPNELHRRIGHVPRRHILRLLGGKGPWVARITGRDPQHGLAREFMRPFRDYRDANSCGSRGVMLCYMLPQGIYEVNEWESWSRRRRYFVRSEAGKAAEISREEVEIWLSL